jgi:hypothetical protein
LLRSTHLASILSMWVVQPNLERPLFKVN